MFQLNRMSIKMWREKKCGGKCNQWIVRKTLEISFDPINKCFYPWGFDMKCPPATSVLTRLVGRSTVYRGGDTEWQVIMRTQTSSVDWSLVSYSEEVVGWSKSPKVRLWNLCTVPVCSCHSLWFLRARMRPAFLPLVLGPHVLPHHTWPEKSDTRSQNKPVIHCAVFLVYFITAGELKQFLFKGFILSH